MRIDTNARWIGITNDKNDLRLGRREKGEVCY